MDIDLKSLAVPADMAKFNQTHIARDFNVQHILLHVHVHILYTTLPMTFIIF